MASLQLYSFPGFAIALGSHQYTCWSIPHDLIAWCQFSIVVPQLCDRSERPTPFQAMEFPQSLCVTRTCICLLLVFEPFVAYSLQSPAHWQGLSKSSRFIFLTFYMFLNSWTAGHRNGWMNRYLGKGRKFISHSQSPVFPQTLGSRRPMKLHQ